jgi:hypothetical protein
MALDTNSGYDEIKSKINSAKAYNDLKGQYDGAKKRTGDSLEKSKSEVTTQVNQLKDQPKEFQRQIKSQFEELLDISKITGGKGANTISYLKRILIKTINKIRPEIEKILLEESVNAIGCSQQQTYQATTGATGVYIKVSSIDLRGSLKIDPATKVGRTMYEKLPVQVGIYPFSLNKELYTRIQSGNPYSVDNGQLYTGRSGQPLFDIQYFDVHPITLVPGGWFKVTLVNRANNINKVIEFLSDYYRSITITDFVNIQASIIDSICGAISIEGDFGIQRTDDATKLSIIIQRILGLCFDNAREIDVSGISKLSDVDGIDESFFEFTDIDLRNIEQTVTNIKNGVVEFQDCDNVKLPVNSAQLVDALNEMLFVEDETDLESSADNLTNVLTSNPRWPGFGLAFSANIKASVDFNFIKLICDGLIRALLTPKIILPIIVMFKAIKSNLSMIFDAQTDEIQSYMDFIKKFKKFVTQLISKIGAIFVRELFNIIKKDIFNLLQAIIRDLAREKADKRIVMVLKLIQLLIVVASFIRDWRRCKSVIDEILQLLTIATTGWGQGIPLPLLFASGLCDGYSEARAFMGTIEEYQKIGIPTGAMPDGSPNLDILSRFGQMKAMAKEDAENGKVQVAIPPLAVPPWGVSLPSSANGKKF